MESAATGRNRKKSAKTVNALNRVSSELFSKFYPGGVSAAAVTASEVNRLIAMWSGWRLPLFGSNVMTIAGRNNRSGLIGAVLEDKRTVLSEMVGKCTAATRHRNFSLCNTDDVSEIGVEREWIGVSRLSSRASACVCVIGTGSPLSLALRRFARREACSEINQG